MRWRLFLSVALVTAAVAVDAVRETIEIGEKSGARVVIARLWRVDPVEAALQIQMEGLPNRNGGARMRGFSMAESDMEAYARQPWVATSTATKLTWALPGNVITSR